jgi:hypothetical protein
MSERGLTRQDRFSVGALEDLRRLPAPRLAPARVEVEITLDGMEDARRAELERRLARELSACGCREGSIAVLIYAVVAPLLIVVGPLAPDSALSWVAIVGGVLAASVLGKVIGLALAHVRLLRAAADVEAAFLEAAVH